MFDWTDIEALLKREGVTNTVDLLNLYRDFIEAMCDDEDLLEYLRERFCDLEPREAR